VVVSALRYLPFVARGLVKAGPPLHLTVYVTGVCNLRCRHCFHFEEVAAAKRGPTVEEVEKLAASTERMGPLVWVSFGGGEPMLRRELPELAEAFGRRGLRHLAIPTNGLVEPTQHGTVDAILEACPETFLSLAVSIDGPPEVHDRIRDEEGAHARALASLDAYLEQARERGRDRLGVGLIVTLTAENQETLATHVEELVRQHRPDNVTINLARGTALDESLLEVDLAAYRRLVETKERLMAEGLLGYFDFPLARLAVARDRRMYRYVEAVARGRDDYRPCTAGRLSAVVFEDGEVHPCELLGRSLGSLADHDWDLARLWESRRAEELRTEIHATRCRCTWECAQADNVLFHPPDWPGLALEALRG